jgi:hypothetical protein
MGLVYPQYLKRCRAPLYVAWYGHSASKALRHGSCLPSVSYALQGTLVGRVWSQRIENMGLADPQYISRCRAPLYVAWYGHSASKALRHGSCRPSVSYKLQGTHPCTLRLIRICQNQTHTYIRCTNRIFSRNAVQTSYSSSCGCG